MVETILVEMEAVYEEGCLPHCLFLFLPPGVPKMDVYKFYIMALIIMSSANLNCTIAHFQEL